MRLEIIIKDSAGSAWNRWTDFGYARCCFKAMLSQWRVRFGAGMLALLLSGTWKVLLACAHWCRHAGATAGRRCRVSL